MVMNKSSLGEEWVKNPDGTPGYTWNPLSGCDNQIDGMCQGGNFPCYAYRLANTRLKATYLANRNIASYEKGYQSGLQAKVDRDICSLAPFHPRLWPDKLDKPLERKKPAGIFTCNMSDLFGIGVPEEWTRAVMNVMNFAYQHRFYLLTKQPQNLIKFSPFPDNCWVGVSATDTPMFIKSLNWLDEIEAKTKYISFEPLLDRIPINSKALQLAGIKWVIIGACTGTMMEMIKVCQEHPESTLCGSPKGKWTAQPKIEWVQEIVQACDKAGIPVFLKKNLKLLIQEAGMGEAKWAAREWVQCKYPVLRQEMPRVKNE